MIEYTIKMFIIIHSLERRKNMIEIIANLDRLREKVIDMMRESDFLQLLKWTNAENLVVHPTNSKYMEFLSILSTKSYPEMGILFISSSNRSHGMSGEQIRLNKVPEIQFTSFCGCCLPIPNHNQWGYDVNTRHELVESIRNTCKKNGITLLQIACYHDWKLQMTQDKDGLHLVNNIGEDKQIDRQRFTTAFKEISIGGKKHPFTKLFES